jgi:hypothetical protein
LRGPDPPVAVAVEPVIVEVGAGGALRVAKRGVQSKFGLKLESVFNIVNSSRIERV